MELNEAVRRIFGQHWRLILVALALGVGVGALFHLGDAKTYTASTRLVLDTPDPASGAESTAIADAAKAIATSPAQVREALGNAHVTARDPVAVAKHHVSVQAFGTSAVLRLSVSDRDPRVAAAVSNTLAAGLIRTRLSVAKGQIQQALAGLDRRIARLNQRISSIERKGTERFRSVLVQRRGVLESERVSLLSTNAVRPKPSIISSASPPRDPDSSRQWPDMALGALLALVLGVGTAGLIETFRPTSVGGDALAREFDTPLLGALSREANHLQETARIAVRLRLAADAAEVRNVGLLSVGPHVGLRNLAERLNVVLAEMAPTRAGELALARGRVSESSSPRWDDEGARGSARPELEIRPFSPEEFSLSDGGAASLVLITPEAVKKTELVDARHLLTVTRLPLLGLITYRPPRGKRWGRARPQTVDSQTGHS